MNDVVDVEVHRSDLVRITYADGLVAEFPVRELRAVCPCAGCRGRRERGDGISPMAGIAIVDAELAGNWGISLRWNDGHENGIYSWDALRDWWEAGREGPLVHDPTPGG